MYIMVLRNYLWAILSIPTILHATKIYQKSVQEFVQDFPATSYLQCTQNYTLHYQPFPLYPDKAHIFFRNKITFADMYIVNVPFGHVYFNKSAPIFEYFYVNNCFIKETQIKDLNFFQNHAYKKQILPTQCQSIAGRVAIISHVYPYCYALWFFDVLTQLALLELHEIEYDYLIIPYHLPFMQESLELWGIDPTKILDIPYDRCIQADTIIFPTCVSQTSYHAPCTNYYPDFLLKYVREKMLRGINKKNLPRTFPKKIFISRKDAHGKRDIANEDEIFELFEQRGFVRYQLSDLAVTEKIALFYHAKIIVSFVGSGSTNIVFCKPETLYIEITQKMVEASYFFISNIFNLKYLSLNDSKLPDLYENDGAWTSSVPLSLQCVKNFLEIHPEL
jgi:hypothetical protein